MFGAPKNELAPPPIARDRDAKEVLRVWAKPDAQQEVVLLTTWDDPAVWGLLLADLARHAAKAYAGRGIPEQETLDRIVQLFHAEMTSPTDTPRQL